MYGTLASLRRINAKSEIRDSSIEDVSLTTKISLAFSVFVSLALLQAKLATAYVPSWHIVTGPLYFTAILSAQIVFHYLKPLKELYDSLYQRLCIGLALATLLLLTSLYLLSRYLEQPQITSITFAILPLYGMLTLALGLLIYFLPGLSDPDISQDLGQQLQPSILLGYLGFTLLTLLFINLTHDLKPQAAYPLTFQSLLHLLQAALYQF